MDETTEVSVNGEPEIFPTEGLEVPSDTNVEIIVYDKDESDNIIGWHKESV